MSNLLSKSMEIALQREAANVTAAKALEGLNLSLAGAKIPGSPHTIWQLIKHLVFWHDLMLDYAEEKPVAFPETPEPGWDFPEAPENQDELDATATHFITRIDQAVKLVKDVEASGNLTTDHPVFELHMAVGHTAYHLGQIVLLRSQLNAWPPPSGGYKFGA